MNIGILGCAGRMGQMIVREVAQTAGATLTLRLHDTRGIVLFESAKPAVK